MLSRTAIITGASHGLGGALARHLASLAGVRAFSGMIPVVNQSGFTETRPGITKRGDAGLHRDLWIAADVARPGEVESPTF
jgi:NAD(P)-dependent dehydrogenase (short-subunit alcohol dehydrogenase family)